jgi:maleate cis-trans isomerase
VTKIGLLIPSVNMVAEGEFHAGTSAEVTVHTARMKVEGSSADYFIREREQAALSLAGS